MDEQVLDAKLQRCKVAMLNFETVSQVNMVCKDLRVLLGRRESLEWMAFLGRREKEETQVCVPAETPLH